MKLLNGINEGQVLQRLGKRGASAQLMGECREAAPVLLTIRRGTRPLVGWNQRQVGTARRGKFSVQVTGIPEGGPYALKLQIGAESMVIHSFYVGDVWILAGQSNMEGVGNRSGAAPRHPLIRAFSMRREWRQAEDPLHVLAESPDACHHGGNPLTREAAESLRKTTQKGVGAGVFFGLEMWQRSKVPQGLICTAHGGTSMRQWDPQRRSLGGESLYASMLASVQATGQPVAGVLWYQGESDTADDAVPLYTGRMKALVAASRRDLRQPALPWVIVQLGRLVAVSNGRGWNSIQEQQRLLPEVIRQLEVVPAVDLVLDDAIHIGAKSFPLLAERLARAADRLVYGNPRELPPLRIRGVRRPRSTEDRPAAKFALEVSVDHVEGELEASGEPWGFEVLDSAGKSIPMIFKTELLGDTIRLHLTQVPPVGSRLGYGVGVNPVCNVTDSRGMALPVFAAQALDEPGELQPFITQWQVSELRPAKGLIRKAPFPSAAWFQTPARSYGENGFIDEHANWVGRSGVVYFRAMVTTKTRERVTVLMGYDGPFRLWLDGKHFFANSYGTNPCLPDESAKPVTLNAGKHEWVVAMNLNHGRSWGFFLRFRKALKKAR